MTPAAATGQDLRIVTRPETTFTVWAPERLELGEGLRWIDGHVYLVDLLAGRLLRADPDTPGPLQPVLGLDEPLGAVAPLEGQPGRWLACAGTGFAVLDAGGGCEWLARPEDANPVPSRMNDGAADPAGRFWAGSMASDKRPGGGSLYRVGLDGEITRVLDGVTIPNGPAFSADGATMYLADTPRGHIDRFTLDPATGDLTGREPFARLKEGEGGPDGMVVDDESQLWVAVWGAGQVHRYRPDGDLDTVIGLPASQPSSVGFVGGARRRLFVTSAFEEMSRPSGYDGALFALDVEVTGPPARPARLG